MCSPDEGAPEERSSPGEVCEDGRGERQKAYQRARFERARDAYLEAVRLSIPAYDFATEAEARGVLGLWRYLADTKGERLAETLYAGNVAAFARHAKRARYKRVDPQACLSHWREKGLNVTATGPRLFAKARRLYAPPAPAPEPERLPPAEALECLAMASAAALVGMPNVSAVDLEAERRHLGWEPDARTSELAAREREAERRRQVADLEAMLAAMAAKDDETMTEGALEDVLEEEEAEHGRDSETRLRVPIATLAKARGAPPFTLEVLTG